MTYIIFLLGGVISALIGIVTGVVMERKGWQRIHRTHREIDGFSRVFKTHWHKYHYYGDEK